MLKNENKEIGISLGHKKKELDQELELKKWNSTQAWYLYWSIYVANVVDL